MTETTHRPAIATAWLPDRWTLGAVTLAGLLLLPIIAVAGIALFPRENIWPHLVEHQLPLYLGNTLILMGFTGLGAAVIGTGTAWLVVMTEFPGRRVLEWALLAPLAVPAYIGAYALVDLLEFAGPVQTALRELMGWRTARDYWFPEIRSMGSAVFVITLSLYPYVYLLARAAFREQSVCVLEVGRALGQGPWGVFWRVGLPLARPAVAAGVAIVCMETLNDFGAVDYFAVPTLTRGIFSIWLDSYNAGGAAQLALVMLGFVFVLLAVERAARKGRKFHHTSKRYRPIRRTRPPGWRGLAPTVLCALPVLFGFVLPVGTIGWHAIDHAAQWSDPALWQAAMHSSVLALAAAAVSCLVAVFMVYGARAGRSRAVRWVAQGASVGYAVPGAVLAVGIMVPFGAFDNRLADTVLALSGYEIGLLLTGSAAAVVFAYVVRFQAIAHGAVDGALGRITPSMELAARTLGAGRGRVLRRVHVPMIRGSVLTAALLIFVDTAKELPATLILRPFNFETLATSLYNAASLEALERASPAAIAIVILGLLPVSLLARTMNRTRPGEDTGNGTTTI